MIAFDAGAPMSFVMRALRRLLRDERGHTLVELLVVLAVLGVVLAPLAGAFTSASRSEARQARREGANSNARLALERMRLDVHCATGVTSVDQNALGGFTLTLAEANDQSPGNCPGVLPAGETASGVQWCTVKRSATRWTLYRFIGTTLADCGVTEVSSSFMVDYLVPPATGIWPPSTKTITTPTSWEGNLWPDAATCSTGSLPAVAFNMSVALDPTNAPSDRYDLGDQISLRNGARCS